jgi:hypothetical protein
MRAKVLCGMLSGALIAFGLSLIGWVALFQVFSHHMFIIGISSPIGAIICAIPFLLIIVGVFVGMRALKR